MKGPLSLFKKYVVKTIEGQTPLKERAEEVVGALFTEQTGDVSIRPAVIESLYVRSVWLKRWIKGLLDECLKYDLHAVSTQDSPAAKAHAYSVNAFLSNCNPKETFYDIRQKYLKDFFLYGNSFIEVAPQTTKGTPNALFVAPGYAIRLNTDKRGQFLDPEKAYSILDPNDLYGDPLGTLPEYSVIHLAYDLMSDKVYGISPLRSIYYELTTDIESARDTQKGSSHIPPGILSFPKASSGWVNELRLKLSRLLRSQSRTKVAAVNVDGKFIELSNKTVKDDIEIQKWIGTKANVFNIPSIKLGEPAERHFSAREARDDFKASIETIVKYEASKLTLGIVKRRFGYKDVIITSPSFATKVDYERMRISTRLVNAGIITPNEARERYLGLPKLEDPLADQLKNSQ